MNILDYWYQALEQEIGLAIPCESQGERIDLRTKLYAARKEAEDPRLEVIVLSMPNGLDIFLAKKVQEMGDA